MTILASSLPTSCSQLKWSASELLQRDTWRGVLASDARDELLAFAANRPDATAATFDWRPEQWPCMQRFGETVRQQLLSGDGVFCLQGLGPLGLSTEQLRCLYIAFGSAIGQPMLQYGLLYPVVDRGASYKEQSVPVSMTNAETCFHTDSSGIDTVPDFVGLLCEEPSLQGGDSLVSNALRVHDILQHESPKLLATLRRDKIRDVVTPGKAKTHENLLRNRFPIFADCDREGGILFRYMRYWIERGHQKASQPLDAEDIEAMNQLDALLQRADNSVRFRLERGDMLWVNNRLMAHNRTSYQDTENNVRQLQRMWLSSPA